MEKQEAAKKWLEALARCDGAYECPKDSQGKRLGPLVGYAGKYSAEDGTKKNFVGEVYMNFARLEQHPELLDKAAAELSEAVRRTISPLPNVALGAPMGGIRFAGDLGRHLGARSIFAEKKVTQAASADGRREESMLVLDRHEIFQDDRVIIVEDVTNNFSTTAQLVELVERMSGKVVGIACFINRAFPEVTAYTNREKGLNLPVISLIHKPLPQYKQEDTEVADDIAGGNIIWKPKNDWARLKEFICQK